MPASLLLIIRIGWMSAFCLTALAFVTFLCTYDVLWFAVFVIGGMFCSASLASATAIIWAFNRWSRLFQGPNPRIYLGWMFEEDAKLEPLIPIPLLRVELNQLVSLTVGLVGFVGFFFLVVEKFSQR